MEHPTSRASTSGSACMALPTELWLDIFSRLRGKDIGRTLSTCRTFKALASGGDIWRAVCERHWPSQARAVQHAPCGWRGTYDYFEWRSREHPVVPALACNSPGASSLQPKHRAILNEWVLEVCMEWQLDSTVAFQAVSFIDHCLAAAPGVHPKRLQLLGVGCLRAAMMAYKASDLATAEDAGWIDSKLDLALAAYMTEDTFTSEEIDEITTDVLHSVPEELATAPNARLYLRYWWYWLCKNAEVPQDALHVYIVAGFYAQLSLLDHEFCSASPSLVAAAALACALRFFGRADWPALVQGYTAYTREQVEGAMAALEALQASEALSLFRHYWVEAHRRDSYAPHEAEWGKALALFKQADGAGGDAAPAGPAAAEPASPAAAAGPQQQFSPPPQQQQGAVGPEPMHV